MIDEKETLEENSTTENTEENKAEASSTEEKESVDLTIKKNKKKSVKEDEIEKTDESKSGSESISESPAEKAAEITFDNSPARAFKVNMNKQGFPKGMTEYADTKVLRKNTEEILDALSAVIANTEDENVKANAMTAMKLFDVALGIGVWAIQEVPATATIEDQ